MNKVFVNIMKRPVLMIGILFMTIFLLKVDFKKIIKDHNNIMSSHSCNAVLIQLDRNIPKSWKTSCDENDLEVIATLDEDIIDKAIKNNAANGPTDKIVTALHYRELANVLMIVSKHSPSYTLERTRNIKVILDTGKFKIAAYTHGSYLFKLASLSNPELIAEHLKATVKIKEITK